MSPIMSADFLKLKKTSFFLLHIGLPLLGILVFFSYQLLAQRDGTLMMIAFCQVLSFVYPIVAALLTNIMINQEVEAGGGFYLLSAVSRPKVLTSKLIYLIGGSLIACLIAIFGYDFLNRMFFESYQLSLEQVMILYLIVFLCSFFQYFFHFFLGLIFSSQLNFLVSTVEFLLASLLMTNLGELIWLIFPGAWGMRLIRVALNHDWSDPLLTIISFPIICVILFTVTLMMLVILFIALNRWEGRGYEE